MFLKLYGKYAISWWMLVDVDWNTFQLVYLHCVVTSVYGIIIGVMSGIIY